ncbi:General transcription factor IIH subunit [Achlya hypogyna]|uniref:General transcription factor IIH subunit n=1 Tax=Achlya hypogyna TaxID=1202772 RepID=A0A1V9YL78_ACHHY|nr:General transcription factor IIH subunit [Achlya hypogyna]
MDDEEQGKGYAWEGSFERSWDGIEEDESGALKISAFATSSGDKSRLRRQEMLQRVRKGLIRYVYVIVDLSKGMSQKDWKPHRCAIVTEEVQRFVADYFDQNPISQLGLIGIKSSVAEKLSDLSGNPGHHIDILKRTLTVHGEPSLQNALEMAKSALKTVPSYGSKEIIVVYGSLTTTDPGDIFATVTGLQKDSIRCSFVGIGAEMHLLRRIAKDTQGTYSVAMDPGHFKDLMAAFTVPSPSLASSVTRFATLVEMGFPQRRSGALSLCVCHQVFTTTGYLCPRCKSKSCELPTVCAVCNLPLVSSPHLARSYHHLFPIANYEKRALQTAKCFGCLGTLHGHGYECPTCAHTFCSDCDIYIHDSLHNCPGCK